MRLGFRWGWKWHTDLEEKESVAGEMRLLRHILRNRLLVHPVAVRVLLRSMLDVDLTRERPM